MFHPSSILEVGRGAETNSAIPLRRIDQSHLVQTSRSAPKLILAAPFRGNPTALLPALLLLVFGIAAFGMGACGIGIAQETPAAQKTPAAPGTAGVGNHPPPLPQPSAPESTSPPSTIQTILPTQSLSQPRPVMELPQDTHRNPKAEKYYLKGLRAMEKGDVHTAEKAFAQAAKADPANRDYSIDQQIAHEHGITELVQGADKARLLGHPEIAREKLAEALRLDPRNPVVAQHIDDLANLSGATQPSEEPTVELAPPIEITPEPGRHSFHLRGSSQDLIQKVFSAYGVTPVVDDTVPTKQTRFYVDDADFPQAARMITLATESFMVPLDPKRVLIARDTKANHTEFDRMALETLQLPGLTDAEMTDVGNVARNLLGIPTTALVRSSDSLTLRAPIANLIAANRTFADLLQGKSEILLEVQMFQIARTRTRNIGVPTPSSLTLFNVPAELNNVIQQNSSLVQQIISSGLASAGDYAAIAAILIASGEVSGSVLGQPFALFGGGLTESGIAPPPITANLSLNSSDTRSLDQVQLRLEDHEEGTLRSGTRYPIETSSYSSISGSTPNIPGLTSAGLSSTLAGLGVNLSSLASQAIPQVQYEDLGLTLAVTPSIESTNLVALKFNLKLTGLQGSSLNGLPVLTNEAFTADVVLNSGASALLMSNLSRQQSNAVTGLPGVSELPGFQSTTNSQVELDVSRLVILVTPHVIRRRHVERAGPQIPVPHS